MKSGWEARKGGKATALCVFYAFYAHAPSLRSNRRWETGKSPNLGAVLEQSQLNEASHDNCIDIRDSTGKAEAAEIMRYYAKSQFACRIGKNLVCRPGQKPRRA